jgi:steroid 5-alpha reductase family enzyme
VANAVYPQSSSGWIVFNASATELVPLIIGSIIWIVGFFFEAVGDYQLRKFVQNPENKGKIIESGLWKYTRHPNYFGEIAMSWGLFVIVITFAIGSPYIWITAIGPIIYTLLIYFVTGVKRTEEHLKKKPGYEDYMERTSILFPLPPKKE